MTLTPEHLALDDCEPVPLIHQPTIPLTAAGGDELCCGELNLPVVSGGHEPVALRRFASF